MRLAKKKKKKSRSPHNADESRPLRTILIGIATVVGAGLILSAIYAAFDLRNTVRDMAIAVDDLSNSDRTVRGMVAAHRITIARAHPDLDFHDQLIEGVTELLSYNEIVDAYESVSVSNWRPAYNNLRSRGFTNEAAYASIEAISPFSLAYPDGIDALVIDGQMEVLDPAVFPFVIDAQAELLTQGDSIALGTSVIGFFTFPLEPRGNSNVTGLARISVLEASAGLLVQLVPLSEWAHVVKVEVVGGTCDQPLDVITELGIRSVLPSSLPAADYVIALWDSDDNMVACGKFPDSWVGTLSVKRKSR